MTICSPPKVCLLPLDNTGDHHASQLGDTGGILPHTHRPKLIVDHPRTEDGVHLHGDGGVVVLGIVDGILVSGGLVGEGLSLKGA